MNRKSQVYAYRIPNKYFPGYKVTSPFHARVVYSVVNNQVIIEDVGFSERCLLHMAGGPAIMQEIRSGIEGAVNKRSDFFNGNKHVHPTILSAIAPHI